MIWRSKPGEISDGRCWCAYSQGFLYIADTLPGLIWQMVREWKHDRHLVG